MADVLRGQAFTIQASHDGFDTSGYRLRLNGIVAGERPVSQLTSGLISFPMPDGLPRATI